MAKKIAAKRNNVLTFFQDSPVRWYDWVILLVLAVFCFVSYEMRDLYHTAGCSYGYLNGHIWDFYDYLAESGIGEDGSQGLFASYLPTLYILFAIWNIPMRLFGIVQVPTGQLSMLPMFWAKLFPCLVFFITGYQVYLIAKDLGMKEINAKICAYAYLTFPIAFFVQFIVGHYEVLGVFCILMGYRAWLKKKTVPFVVWFGIAVTIKYYALLIFIPLLILREKNFWKICLQCICVLLPAVLEFVFYRHSQIFRMYAFGIGGSGDNPTGYITNLTAFTGFVGVHGSISLYLTIIAYALICAYAYFKKTDEKSEQQYSLYLACLAMSVLFCMSKWHPQWLMLVIPFWVLSTFLHKNTKIFLILDLAMMLFFCIFVVQIFPGIADEFMLTKGVFSLILPNGACLAGARMTNFLAKIDESMSLTFLTALMLVYTFFKHPKYYAQDDQVKVLKCMGWTRARFILGMMIFIIPSMLCVYQSVKGYTVVYSEPDSSVEVEMTEGTVVSQEIEVTKSGTVKQIVFPLMKDAGDGYLTVEIVDDAGTVLYKEERHMANLYIGEKTVFEPGVQLEPGTYEVRFTLDRTKDLEFNLYADQLTGDETGACIDGKKQKYRIQMDLYQ